MMQDRLEIFLPAGAVAEVERVARLNDLDERFAMLLYFEFVRQSGRRKRSLPIGYIPMFAKRLQKIRDDYKRYLTAFEGAGLLVFRVPHLNGHAPRIYTLGDDFAGAIEFEWYTIRAKKVLKHCFPAARPEVEVDPYLERRIEYLDDVELDFDGAMAWATSQRHKRKPFWWPQVVYSLKRIQRGDRWIKKDRHGREHSPLVTLPKHVRQHFLAVNEHQPVELDLPAAQPLLLWSELNRRGRKGPEVRLLRQMLESDLYDCLANISHDMTGKKIARKTIKKQLVVWLMGRGLQNQAGFAFTNTFPTITGWLENVKAKHPKRVGRALQQLESKLIFDVSERMTDQCVEAHFSVHDALAVRSDQVELGDRIFTDRLKEEGINWYPSLIKADTQRQGRELGLVG